jgi:FemAB-related protein (PEP-CTERM system-associated)
MTLAMCERDVRVMRVTPGADEATWRRMAEAIPGSHLAHAVEWANVISTAYGHEPLYLAAVDENGHNGLLPAFVVRRPLLGSVIASMPFLDGGGPCSGSPALATALVDMLAHEAQRLGAGRIELRSAQKLDLAAEPLDHKVNMVLPLGGDPQHLWEHLDGSVRNQVRKAGRAGLTVERGGVDRLHEFMPIYAARMRELGSPAHDARFFRTTFDQFGSRARVLIVRKGSEAIGGLVALTFKDTIVVPWAASLNEHIRLCPNMLLYWEAIRDACDDGRRLFDFGRSTRGSGTYHFKRQWGALETPLYWYAVTPDGQTAPQSSATRSRTSSRLANLWRRLPRPVTRRLGPYVRKYLIQ